MHRGVDVEAGVTKVLNVADECLVARTQDTVDAHIEVLDGVVAIWPGFDMLPSELSMYSLSLSCCIRKNDHHD